MQRRFAALSEAKSVLDAKVSSFETLVRSLRADLRAAKRTEKEQAQRIQALEEVASKVTSFEKRNGDLQQRRPMDE